jgi:hypothetical protein
MLHEPAVTGGAVSELEVSGLAQASQSAAGMSRTEGTASRMISDDGIEPLNEWRTVALICPSIMIVHCNSEFKAAIRPLA